MKALGMTTRAKLYERGFNMKKLLVLITVIAMLLQLFAVAGFAESIANIGSVDTGINSADEEVSITGRISSGEGKNITIIINNPNEEIDYVDQSVSGENGNFMFTFVPNVWINGEYTIRIGGEGVEEPYSGSFEIGSEGPSNNAPQLAAIGSKAVKEGETLGFTVTAEDADEDTLSYSAENLPEGAEFYSTTGEFSWTPEIGQSGEYSVTFTVSDGTDSDSETISIVVSAEEPSNNAPQLAAIGSKAVKEGETLGFTITAEDADEDTLSYSVENLPEGAEFDSATGEFSWTPEIGQSGEYSVTFIVSDGTDSDSETISIIVSAEEPSNNAPQLAVIGDKTVRERRTLEFTITALDEDEDNLTFSADNLPQGSSFDAASGKFSWTPNSSQSGEYNVTFNVTDGIASDSETIKITVTNVSSGGGGGDSDDDSPSATPTPKPAKTSLNAEFSEEDIQSALDNVKDGVAKLEVKDAAGANEVKAVINGSFIGKSQEKMIEEIEVDTGIAVVSIKTGVLLNSEGTAPSNVELSVSKVDSSMLTEDAKSIVGNNTVYDFNLSVDGKKVTGFNKGDIVVSVDYTLKPGEKPGNVVVYYIDDSGNLEIVTNGKYNPETGKVEFRPTHFSKYTAVYNEKTFIDIGGSDVAWALDSIESLAARGVINGDTDGTFRPNNNVTRAEFVLMLTLAFDLGDTNAESTFADIQKGEWYYQAIASAESLGIVYGNSTDGFGPDEFITREDIAAILYRASRVMGIELGSKIDEVRFADSSEIEGYAADAVKVMQKAGIIYGKSGGRFAPKDNATKAETAAMIHGMFESVY